MATVTQARSVSETITLGPFTGGLNLRDAATEVAANELSDGTNFTLDERGVAIKRNDCPVTGQFPSPPGTVMAFFYSNALFLAFIQVGITLYKCATGGGSWTSIGTGNGAMTTQACAFCDFAGKVVITHAGTGATTGETFTYDGTTFTGITTTAVGSSIAAWQNKVWIGHGLNSNVYFPGRLWWSNAGNPGVFTTATDFVDLREKDDNPITALFGGSGLLAFKEGSTYRVNDSTTGSFQTIDWTTGCVGPRAVASQDGTIVTWSTDGLYAGNGIGRFVNVGDKVRPRFLSTTVNGTTKPLISAVAVNGRIYFGFPRTSSTIPDAILEYNPRTGWIMETYLGGTQVAQLGKVPFTPPVGFFSSGSAAIRELLNGTTRTGYTCSLSTGYVEPFGGKTGRIRRIKPELTLPASSSVASALNYTDASGAPQSLSLTSSNTSVGTQRPNIWPGSVGQVFQYTVNDTAGALASLSVFQVSLEALSLER